MTQRGHYYTETLSCFCEVKGKGVSLLRGSVMHRIPHKFAAVKVCFMATSTVFLSAEIRQHTQ